ncbi:unnamed protein product [Schistosoma haematobium]|nr:unnamed protein product [Schistosoma haematobium]
MLLGRGFFDPVDPSDKMMLIRNYLDQNAPSLQDFDQLIQSYQLEYGIILLRDYQKLLQMYNTTEISFHEFKYHTNYLLQYIWEKLHTGHWKNVHICWRILYSSIKLLIVLYYLYKSNNDDDPNSYQFDPDHSDDHDHDLYHYHPFIELIKELDLSLIMGYPIFNQFASKLASKLHQIIMNKRRLCNENDLSLSRLFQLDNHNPDIHHDLDHDLDRFIQINEQIKINLNKLDHINCPSIELFNDLIKFNKPFIITNAINFWPAYNNNNQHKWTINYWLHHYGYRLVPIEIGQKYTQENWGQKLMTIHEFINHYFNQSIINNENTVKGYLAQYDIFTQIPELENDIYIPDYCYVTGGDEPINNSDDNDNHHHIDTIETNIWFGPKNTISPLHHDNDRANLLTQIHGYKLIILYSALETKNLYPYNDNPMLCNTSKIDLDHLNIDLMNEFPKFQNVHGYYSILKPGEMLYIPPRCWHYVRSLTASYSVNFWWNISSSLIPSWE